MDEAHSQQHLKIKNLTLKDFRNYSYLNINNIGNLSIFIGDNATGKTSILEALQIMTELRSFRVNTYKHLIRFNSEEASISCDLVNSSRQLKEQLIIHQNKRSYILNGKNKTIQDLKGLLPAVLFTPDDLNLIKGPHSNRRDSADYLGIQLSKNFYSVRKDYKKLIQQKHQALKDGVAPIYLQSINEILTKVGAQYIIHRATLLKTLIPVLKKYYSEISGETEDISLSYSFSWSKDHPEDISSLDKADLFDIYTHQLSKHHNEEYETRQCKIGPHADHIDFYIKKKEEREFQHAGLFASQGQQRSIVLAYKLAELSTIQSILGQRPILLLDDVMSELDERRRLFFLKLLEGDIQTFITTTNLAYFSDDIINKADIYKLPLVD